MMTVLFLLKAQFNLGLLKMSVDAFDVILDKVKKSERGTSSTWYYVN